MSNLSYSNSVKEPTVSLFRTGKFPLHSGGESDFKIDCDWLTDEDIEALAHKFGPALPPYSMVIGIPWGGIRLATELENYTNPQGGILIVDDVYTTGNSMEQEKNKIAPNYTTSGIVIFARKAVPDWITAIFQTNL